MCLYVEPPPPTEKRRLYCPSFLFNILIPFATRLVHPFIFESMEVMKKYNFFCYLRLAQCTLIIVGRFEGKSDIDSLSSPSARNL